MNLKNKSEGSVMRIVFFRLIVSILIVFASTPVFAQERLTIVSPGSEKIVTPGQRIRIVMNQAADMEPRFFNSTVSLLPSPIYSERKLRAIDPYIIEILVSADIKPGLYPVVGVGKRVGETAFTLTPPIYLRVLGAPIVGVEFESETLFFRFPGEVVYGRLDAIHKDGRRVSIPDELLKKVKWTMNRPDIASVNDAGAILALSPGDALVKAEVDGMTAYLGVNVKVSKVRGDYNLDNVVDKADLAILQQSLNFEVTAALDPRDLNKDGKIDALDLRVLTTLCSRPHCAAQ